MLKDCSEKKAGAVFPTMKIVHEKLMSMDCFKGKWKLETTRKIIQLMGFRYIEITERSNV